MAQAIETRSEIDNEAPQLSIESAAAGIVVRVGGEWRLRQNLPALAPVIQELESAQSRKLTYDSKALTGWDSSLLALVDKISQACKRLKIEEDRSGLPEGLKALLRLSEAVPDNEGARARAA